MQQDMYAAANAKLPSLTKQCISLCLTSSGASLAVAWFEKKRGSSI